MQEFFEIAKTDFLAAYGGAWIFPMLLAGMAGIIFYEKDSSRKWLFGGLPFVLLVLYWCPASGLVFMKLVGENVYWRFLWLILPAVIIPYACCLILKKLEGLRRQAAFLLMMAVIVLGGKSVLSEEWFEGASNAWKVPQYVVSVCDLLPGKVHVLASNRLTPYLRLYDPTLTLEHARNALVYNGQEVVYGASANLYKAIQEPEIDVDLAGPLAREQGCTFLIFSVSRTYKGDWADYGYREYANTEEFVIFVDEEYKEGEDTRKWED